MERVALQHLVQHEAGLASPAFIRAFVILRTVMPNDPIASRPPPGPDVPGVERLKRLARFMDSSIRLPGGYRIGWDGVIGLVPGVGDLIGLLVSSGILLATARLGVPRVVLVRMAMNVGLEALVGTVPIAGDVFDFVFKANQRNLALAERALQAPATTKRRSGAALALVVLVVLGLVILLGWLIVAVFAGLIALIT